MDEVLITGVGGFIGSFLAKALLKRGYKVVGIDNFDPYYPKDYKLLRLEMLKGYPNFEFYDVDFTEYESLRKVFKNRNFSGVLHIGAKAGVRASIQNPEGYIRVNTLGTLNILKVMLEFGVRKILMASTSSIYAGHKPPFVEGMKTDTPISPYAVSKKAAENLLYTYHHLYGIDAFVLRYFTVYGPAGRPDMSIFKIFYSAFSGSEFPLYGDGNQRRSFTFIGDVVEGTIKAYEVMKGFEVINIGNPTDEALLNVINHVESLVGNKVKIRFLEFNKADVMETKADITKARNLLNWEPKTDIYTGLEITYNWFKENWDRIKEIFPEMPRI